MSTSIYDGGPAFAPGSRIYDNESKQYLTGMSLLAYFAAHAPNKIPRWFKSEPTVQAPPISMSIETALTADPRWPSLSDRQRAQVRGWMGDGCYDLDPGGMLDDIGRKAWGRINDREKERDAANDAREAERYFAWRWHYAEVMVKRATS